MAAASSPNDEQNQTGGINRVFKYFYAIHLKGRQLKAKNQKLYYLTKWILFSSIIGLIYLPSFL